MRRESGGPLVRSLVVRRVLGLHGDQRGSISIVSVFALLLLVMLLGMVMNSSRQIDRKVRMQNAADSMTWSSGQVMVRSMNTLAFTNHLMADTFALTAFMREARDRDAETYTSEILANWERIGPFLATSEFPPFADLGEAITEKIPGESAMATTFGGWAAAASEMILPVLEEILATEAIPEYQRALAAATPGMAQQTASEVARRHGQAWPRPAQLTEGRVGVEARQGRGGVGPADVAGLKAQLIDQGGADTRHGAPVKRPHQHPGLFSAQEVARQRQLARGVQLTGLHGEDVGVHALSEGVNLHDLLGREPVQQGVGHKGHAHDAALHVGLQGRVPEQLRDRA